MKFSFVLIVLLVESFALEENDICDLGNGLKGVIRPAYRCDYISTLLTNKNLNEANKYKKGFVEHRGLISNLPAYCCPVNPPRKSVLACKKFGVQPNRSSDKPSRRKRIIGGTLAKVAEFPYFAALGFVVGGNLKFNCGGSLISEYFVLTAAHCCSKPREVPVIARLGKTSLNLKDTADRNNETDIDVVNIILHPDYIALKKYNDISLIKLKSSPTFAQNIWPACLYNSDMELPISEDLYISGFGTNDLENEPKAKYWMLKGIIKPHPLYDCRKKYNEAFNKTNKVDERHKPAYVKGLPDGIISSMICASNQRGSKHVDTCKGDSGSGLMVRRSDVYIVYGVTSFGVSCYTPLPSFYTRVSSYIDWIERIVWQ